MSMLGGRVPPGRESVGETVAAYPSYEAAQKAVSTLIAAEIPARDIAIVGQDLRSVERVTGRLGYATAARTGAVNGLFLGLLFSFIFVLGTPSVQISVFLGVLLVGVAIGMIFSLVMYSIVRRRRDFASVMQVAAARYEVCVAAPSLSRARATLGPATVVAAPPRTDPVDAEPPKYGERLPAPGAGDAAGERPSAPEPPDGPPPAGDSEPPRYGQRLDE